MTDPAITVRNLSKQYVLGGEVDQQKTFREMITGLVGEPLRRLRKLQGRHRQQETFWALKDISFEVQPGEVLGIIGRNGAGKSTLLKILSRITAPTSGEIQYRGRLASLLEVGTGFHPELSGRENIFINGAILGMAKAEIKSKFDEIVDFAGIEQFLDTPVKRYSSGMYVRLAFAVAAHLDPDILVVDEVLAVGDAEFQKKCLGKMKEVSSDGRTVFFVSHNMASIKSLCSRVIQINKGLQVNDGAPSLVVSSYLHDTSSRITNSYIFSTKEHRVITSFSICSLQFVIPENRIEYMFGDPINILLGVHCDELISDVRIGIALYSEGIRICTMNSPRYTYNSNELSYVSCRIIEGVLLPGAYTLVLGAHKARSGCALDWVSTEIPFVVLDIPVDGTFQVPKKSWGVVLLANEWEQV